MEKRISVVISEENYQRFLVLCEKLSMPRITIHSIIDDAFGAVITSMEQSLETVTAKGKLTMADMFTQIGQQLSKMDEKEKQDEAQAKTLPVAKRASHVVKKLKEKNPK